MEQNEGDYFSRQGLRGTNGRIVPVQGIPRKLSTVSSKSCPAATVSPQTQQSQQQQQQLQVPSTSRRSTRSSRSNHAREKVGCKDFDDVIAKMGNGKYQQALIYYVFAPLSALQPILAYNAVFMLFTPDHWCSGPDVKYWTDPEEYKLVNIPMLTGIDGLSKYSSCTMYGPNRTEINCPHGWEYDRTEYRQTLSSLNDWVCDRAKIPTYILLASTIGNAIGTLTFGLLSDHWGRKPTLFLALSLNIVFRLISLFISSNWYLLCLAQFFIGSSITALYVGPSLIAAELCNKDDRAEVYAITWTVCLVGIILLPFVSWLCSDWFLIGLVTTAIGICMLCYYPIIPESPRWLLQKGRVDEAAAILKKVWDYNNKHDDDKKKRKNSKNETDPGGEEMQERRKSTISAHMENDPNYLKHLLTQVLEQQHIAEEKVSIAEGRGVQLEDRSKATVLFTKLNLAKNTLLLTICWSMNTLIYTTMTYNSTHMSGSHFKNFFLLGIIEVPSGFLGGYMADTVGRRWTGTLNMGLCALSCFATSLMVYNRALAMEVLLGTLSKMVITVSFIVVYCQGTELFPTELRSTGSGIASTVGQFVCIFAPLISELSTYSAAYPWIVMGACSTIGMITAAFLPETLNLGLPETIEEANNIGKGNKFWSIGAQNVTKTRKKKVEN